VVIAYFAFSSFQILHFKHCTAKRCGSEICHYAPRHSVTTMSIVIPCGESSSSVNEHYEGMNISNL